MVLYLPDLKSKYENDIGLIGYFPLNCGMMVYESEMRPFMPESGVCTCSLCTGSYISKEFGTTGFGSVNNFKFPVPEATTFKSSDSPFFKIGFRWCYREVDFPTAPEKSIGFPASGNGFTVMVLLPAETRLLSSTTCT
jgi:hypothetical protein